MGPVFIAVVDSVRARVYGQQARGSPLRLVEELTHAASGLHNQDLVSDRPGAIRSNNNPGGLSGAHPSPKEHEQEKFALEIANHLEKARATGKFKELVLVMGPRMLGHVKHKLSDLTQKHIALVIDSDIAHLDDNHVAKHLRDKWFVPEIVFAK